MSELPAEEKKLKFAFFMALLTCKYFQLLHFFSIRVQLLLASHQKVAWCLSCTEYWHVIVLSIGSSPCVGMAFLGEDLYALEPRQMLPFARAEGSLR